MLLSITDTKVEKMETNRSMKNTMHRLSAAAFLFVTGGLGAGDLSGKITLQGTPRPEVVIDMSADPYCAQQHPAPATTRHYVAAPDGGLADVFV